MAIFFTIVAFLSGLWVSEKITDDNTVAAYWVGGSVMFVILMVLRAGGAI
jgi:hypothetical protein